LNERKQQQQQYKNPNVLTGHEGELLMVIKEFMANTDHDPNEVKYASMRQGFTVMRPRVDVVMYLDCKTDEQAGGHRGHVRFLFKDKIYKSQMNPQTWLWYFTPYPHGGFIEKANTK
jgi:hypothetical protein